MMIKAMEQWVWNTLENGLGKKYSYHNMGHVSSVVRDLEVIANHYKVSKHNLQLLKTAALFHDIAFVKSHINHEAESARMAEKQLPDFGYGAEEIKIIAGMILATKIPQSPKTFLEGILCDADLFYLGGQNYFEIAAGLKREWQNIGLLNSERQWLETQLAFLQNHSYHTTYAQTHLEPGKKKVISQLENSLKALED